MKRCFTGTLLVGALLVTGWTPAAAATVLSRSVIGTGGAVSNGTMRSTMTVGQPAIGLSLAPTLYVCHGFWCGGYLPVSGVNDDPIGGTSGPGEFAFGLPAPNPTRGLASFELALPAPGQVRLMVVDVTGRLVSMAQDGRMDAGRHSIVWDGRDAGGMSLARGVYYARLEVDGRVVGKRSLVLIR